MGDEPRRGLLHRYGLPPAEIYRRSFATVDALLSARPGASDPPWSAAERQVVRRVVHATGDPEIASLVRFTPGAVEAGIAALRRAAPIVTDVRMVAAGVNERLVSAAGCAVRVLIARPGLEETARQLGMTRSAVATEAALPELAGAVVVIGNAPTALLALLDALDDHRCQAPALIVGMPVGFIATREAKAELLARPYPAISIEGTRGGSAAAAATVNALLALCAGSRERESIDESAPSTRKGAAL